MPIAGRLSVLLEANTANFEPRMTAAEPGRMESPVGPGGISSFGQLWSFLSSGVAGVQGGRENALGEARSALAAATAALIPWEADLAKKRREAAAALLTKELKPQELW